MIFAAGVSSGWLKNLNFSFDMTQQKEFSLHPETVGLFKEFEDSIEIKLYISNDLQNVPAAIVQHIERTQRMISQLSKLNSEKIIFKIERLEPDTEEVKELSF